MQLSTYLLIHPRRILIQGRSSVARLAICLITLVCGSVQAIELGGPDGPKNLAPVIEVLEDPSRSLTIEDIHRPDIEARFVPWEKSHDVNVGFSQSAWWFRVALSREMNSPVNWLLEIPYTYNRVLDFYPPGRPPVLTGSDRPVSSRPLFHPHYLFPIQPSETPEFYYFRAESSFAISLPLIAWQPIAFYKASMQGFFLQAMYYGGIIALLLYNLALAISLRDRRFLFYVGFAFFMCLGVFAGNGLGRLALWPEWNRFDEVAGTFFLTISTTLSVLFSLQFLQTRRHAPKVALALYGLLIALLTLSVLQLLGVWIPSLVSLAFQTLAFSSLALFIGLVTASVFAVRAGVPGISLFIAAWSAFWIGGLIAALRLLDLVPTNALTSNAIQISSAIEMTLFAFALAEMVKIEKRERLNAQNDLLQAKQALLDTMRSQEAVLEKTIQERTLELNIALRKEKEVLGQYVRFGSLISHEFRNPLGVINSQATLLKKEQPLNERGAERITTIKTAVRRLVKLFDKWLEGDRLETLLEREINKRPIAAKAWLEQLLKKNTTLLEEHQITIAAESPVCDIQADPDMLEIAMLNLLENACKYSEPQSRIIITTVRKDGWSGFSVTDEGIGISESHQNEIFNDYLRVENPSQPGLGLGLAFVKRIMLAHGGSVSVTSTLGIGSTFTLLFPTDNDTPDVPHAIAIS